MLYITTLNLSTLSRKQRQWRSAREHVHADQEEEAAGEVWQQQSYLLHKAGYPQRRQGCFGDLSANVVVWLDLQVRIVEKKVQSKLFKKPISNKHVILVKSALPGGVKRAALTQDPGGCLPSPEH